MSDHSAHAEALIADLDSGGSSASQEAVFSLAELGDAAVVPLLAVIGRLTVGGQRRALDVLHRLPHVAAAAAAPDRFVAEALLPLLDSDDDVVVGWTADALAHFRVVEAVPKLAQALHRVEEAGVPGDWAGPAGLRRALALLRSSAAS